MSLFALNYEYQRSVDRIWEDASAHSRVQTAPAPEEVEGRSHRSVRNLNNKGEAFLPDDTRNIIEPRAMGGSQLMQYDAKAWRRFLDSKRGD